MQTAQGLMAGERGRAKPPAARADHVHCVWELQTSRGNAQLVIRDPRRFGGLWVFDSVDELLTKRWNVLGLDALTIDATALSQQLGNSNRSIKAALMDQSCVAGIGNIYADEALHQAGVHPLRPAGDLTPAEVGRLHRAIRSRLRAGVAAGGSSIDRYRDALGRRGSMQDQLRVHTHAGEPCPRCGTTVLKSRVAGRGTYHCPRCQPAP